MYVTRPLSHYYRWPETAHALPPDGPGSGVLVIEDEEVEAQATCCWGFCWTTQLYHLPFPQNKKIKVRLSRGGGEGRRTYRDDVYFVPVIDQPLSSNRYYVIRADRHRGKACICSKEEDQTTTLCCTFASELDPAPFDHKNIYQQVEIVPRKNGFTARAVADDGIAPEFLRRKGWKVYTSKPKSYNLKEALGMNSSLRAEMPHLNFQITTAKSLGVVVGRWYCPFMFVKEDIPLKDQMKMSTFYEMELDQFWEEIFSCENYCEDKDAVEVSVDVRREIALLSGSEIVEGDGQVVDGVVWFKGKGWMEKGLGLSEVVWERMRWEMGRGGWDGGVGVERVERKEVYEGGKRWKRFGCYVLVERFVLKRMDMSLALTYEFKHTNKIRVKWE